MTLSIKVSNSCHILSDCSVLHTQLRFCVSVVSRNVMKLATLTSLFSCCVATAKCEQCNNYAEGHLVYQHSVSFSTIVSSCLSVRNDSCVCCVSPDAAEVLRQNRRLFEQNVAKSMRGGYVGSVFFERCLMKQISLSIIGEINAHHSSGHDTPVLCLLCSIWAAGTNAVCFRCNFIFIFLKLCVQLNDQQQRRLCMSQMSLGSLL